MVTGKKTKWKFKSLFSFTAYFCFFQFLSTKLSKQKMFVHPPVWLLNGIAHLGVLHYWQFRSKVVLFTFFDTMTQPALTQWLNQLEQNIYFCSSIVEKIYFNKVGDNMKIKVNIKVIKWGNENLLYTYLPLINRVWHTTPIGVRTQKIAPKEYGPFFCPYW